MNKINTKLMDVPDEVSLKYCADIIKRGGTVAFPTETVYGLGADGLNSSAVEKILIAKGRPNDNPLILHIHDISVLDKYVKEVPKTLTVLSRFLPNEMMSLARLLTCSICPSQPSGVSGVNPRSAR